MPFNINQFNADVAKSGIANPSHFEGWILSGPRETGILNSLGIPFGMAFRIESVNMPGRTLTTLDQQFHGPLRSIPYRFSTQPLTFSVILSKDMREREAFMQWQDAFVGPYRTNVNRSAYEAMFDTKYYDDAVGTFEIRQYSYPLPQPQTASKETQQRNKTPNQTASAAAEKYQLQTRMTFFEAYPVTVNDVQLSWGDEGYGKLQVEMRYHYFIEDHRTAGPNAANERERDNRAKNNQDFEALSRSQRSTPDLIPDLIRNRPGRTGNPETDVGGIN